MARRIKKTFDSFEHSTSLHLKREIAAMNNKFENLVGYGILCVMMEMCAKELTGAIPFSALDQKVFAASLSVDERTLNSVVGYLKVVGLISISRGFLKVDIIEKNIIKKRIRREKVRTAVAEGREKLKRKKGINLNTRETEAQKRRRIWNEFDEILILTDRVINEARLKYPGYGDITVYFKEFKKFVKTGYALYNGKITHENYVANFYTYMNTYKKPLLAALDEHERKITNRLETTQLPPKFGFEK